MRITLAMQNETTVQNLNQHLSSMDRLARTVSSGKRLATPSDDPSGWAQSLNLQANLKDYDSIIKNIDFATGWNQVTDNALTNLSDLVSQARQIGIQAASANSAGTSGALVQNLDQIINQVATAAGAEFQNRYVFSGLHDTPPITVDPSTGAITHNASDGDILIRQDRLGTNFFKVNLTADEVFNYTDGSGTSRNVVDEIKGLRDAVQANDTALITQKLSTLKDAFAHLGQQQTLTGARLSSLETQKSALGIVQDESKKLLANIEEADVPDAITRLQQSQTAYQAALKVTAMLDGLNLAAML
jgi:flagellar hook-associated protein 3 FlgL